MTDVVFFQQSSRVPLFANLACRIAEESSVEKVVFVWVKTKKDTQQEIESRIASFENELDEFFLRDDVRDNSKIYHAVERSLGNAEHTIVEASGLRQTILAHNRGRPIFDVSALSKPVLLHVISELLAHDVPKVRILETFGGRPKLYHEYTEPMKELELLDAYDVASKYGTFLENREGRSLLFALSASLVFAVVYYIFSVVASENPLPDFVGEFFGAITSTFPVAFALVIIFARVRERAFRRM